MSNAETLREALFEEALGDLEKVSRELKAMADSLPNYMHTAEEQLNDTRKALATAAANASASTRTMAQSADALQRSVDNAARQFHAAGRAYSGARATLALMVPLAVIAGACAGGVAAWFVIHALAG